MKIKITKKQLQQSLDLKSPVEAHSIMNVLVRQGTAKEIGFAKKSGGGKSPKLYEVPQTATLDLFPNGIPNQMEVANKTDEVKTDEVEQITASETQVKQEA